jgi:hypothetical protein
MKLSCHKTGPFSAVYSRVQHLYSNMAVESASVDQYGDFTVTIHSAADSSDYLSGYGEALVTYRVLDGDGYGLNAGNSSWCSIYAGNVTSNQFTSV